MQPIYRYFGGEDNNLDYSEDAAREMFLYETTGKGNLKATMFSTKALNGYAVGKHWMDVMIKMWLQDIRQGVLFIDELYKEHLEWHWWLDRVIRKPLQRKT